MPRCGPSLLPFPLSALARQGRNITSQDEAGIPAGLTNGRYGLDLGICGY